MHICSFFCTYYIVNNTLRLYNISVKELLTTKGEFKMPTKSLEKKETMPAKDLRSLSQKNLLDKLSQNEKLAIIMNDDIKAALLRWDKYEQMVDRIEFLSAKVEELQSDIEDHQLNERYGEAAVKAEENTATSYGIQEIENTFFRDSRQRETNKKE